MKIILSNFQTDEGPREVMYPGDALLTYTDLRAVEEDGEGDAVTVMRWDAQRESWVLLQDGTLWTDVHVAHEWVVAMAAG